MPNISLDNHDRKTNSRRYNALFAVANIKTLIAYYNIFKELNTDLRISAIFTYEENEDLEFKQEHSKDSLEKSSLTIIKCIIQITM